MKSLRKLSIISATAFVTLTSVTAFAADASFSGSLPANQGDTEVSTSARASNDVDHFTLNISSLGGGYTAVRAWTEGGLGDNYSSPYTQVSVGGYWNVFYYENTIPWAGQNVTLNLDNPVYTSSTVPVAGSWNPN